MITTNPTEFYILEALQSHALCDRALIPRRINGELLSMAQRVAVLERCYAGLAARLGMDPAVVIQ